MKKWSLIVLGLVFLAQWAAPLSMLVQREQVLHKGALYYFETAPVDPYDAFRGRYVWLSIVERNVSQEGIEEPFKANEWAYVGLTVAEDDTAKLRSISRMPPAEGDYLRVQVTWVSGDKVSVSMPFDRFYMDETDAPEAERIYNRRARGRDAQPARAAVRVYKGRAVLEEVLIDGKPLRTVVLEERAKQEE